MKELPKVDVFLDDQMDVFLRSGRVRGRLDVIQELQAFLEKHPYKIIEVKELEKLLGQWQIVSK